MIITTKSSARSDAGARSQSRPQSGPFRRRRAGAEQNGELDDTYAMIARARGGDRDALGALYARYADSVFHCVYRILQDSHEAEDVTQHVFLKLMSVLPKYERRQVPFSAWLTRVARNAALDAERKRRPVDCAAEPETGCHEEHDYQRGQSLRDALEALPASQRHVVILRHVVGLSATEIAVRLGKTPGSIHALDQRGRRTLQGDLIELGSAPVTRQQASPCALSSAA